MGNKIACQARSKLSMIVPVYGVEAYIHRFLESLSSNLHDALEVIFVDDGTKDRCGEILDAYQAQHPQSVRVIHKKNGGVSSARNAGLAAATGDYLLFADPDDYLAEHYTENILDAIEKYHQPDMILFDYYKWKKGKSRHKKGSGFAEGTVERKAFLHSFSQDRNILNHLWNKVFKRSVCEGQWFDESLRFCEDAKWLTDVSLASSSIVYVNKVIYYHDEREGSLSKEASPVEIQSAIRIFLERCEKYEAVLDKVDFCAPIRFMMKFCVLRYQGKHNEDISSYERFIRRNIVKIVLGDGLSKHEKKRMLFIALGLGQYYYRPQ